MLKKPPYTDEEERSGGRRGHCTGPRWVGKVFVLEICIMCDKVWELNTLLSFAAPICR